MTVVDDAPSRSVLVDYFTNLDEADAEGAAAAFSAEAVYIRQFPGPDGELVFQALAGRGQLRSLFDSRGIQPYRHRIRRVLMHRRSEFVEGVVDPGPQGTPVVFMASAVLDEHGLIARYLALAVDISTEMLAWIVGDVGNHSDDSV